MTEALPHTHVAKPSQTLRLYVFRILELTLRLLDICLFSSLRILWCLLGRLMIFRGVTFVIYLLLYRALVKVRVGLDSTRLYSRRYPAREVATRLQQLVDFDLLENAIVRWTLDLYRPGEWLIPIFLEHLALVSRARFKQLGDIGLLTEVIDLRREALNLRPPGHPDRPDSLSNLAIALKTRFEHLGGIESLAEAIDLHRQALNLRPSDHPDHLISLNNLAIALHVRFKHSGDIASLIEAVDKHRQALDMRPFGHPYRSMSLNNLASALKTRFEHLGDIDSLLQAIDLHREALLLRPPGHPDRASSLNNLAMTLQTRFEHFGNIESLVQAIDLHREALDLRPPGHPDLSSSLNNLANALRTQFEHLRDTESLVEAVDLLRQTLDMHPPGHPDRSISLNNLATALQTRFAHLDDTDAIVQAIELLRKALELRPLGRPDRSGALNNLGNALHSRFIQLGDIESLSEAIDLHRQALDMHPPGHPNRSSSLNNLATGLKTRFERHGDLGSRAEVIDLYRKALALRPSPHPGRPTSLANLANALGLPPSNLCLPCDLDETLDLSMDGLQSCGNGHFERARFLFIIGDCLLRPGTHVFDFRNGVVHMLESLQDRTSPASRSLTRGVDALDSIENAYRWSNEQLETSELRTSDHDNLVLQVYMSVIRLLPRAAHFGLNHMRRLRELSCAETVSRDAATRAIWDGRNTEAVEMLEEGRGLFWSQALRLRATGLDDLPLQDSQELRRLFGMLERSDSEESLSAVHREQNSDERRRLSTAAETLISDIRSRPGMSRFLLPPAFSSLAQALPEMGFVVILVSSKLGYHALVLDRTVAQAKSIAVVAPQGRSFYQTFRAALPRDGGKKLSSTKTANVSRLTFGVSKKKIKTQQEQEQESFEQMLAQLWMLIMKPVIDVLKLKV
jgi:tetratricopeptide (TPR) repeat protein